MTINFTEPLCSGDVRKEAATALITIKNDFNARLPVSYELTEHPIINLQSGQLSQVASHSRRNENRDWAITVKIISPPAHGKVTLDNAQGLIRTSDGQAQSHAMTRVYYQSESGFVGSDSFTYERTSEDPSDPLNGRSYTIDLQIK
jgi:hypothetical protein